MAPLDSFSRFYYRLKGGRIRARWAHEMPLRQNLRIAFEKTMIGAFSKKIYDFSHFQFYR